MGSTPFRLAPGYLGSLPEDLISLILDRAPPEALMCTCKRLCALSEAFERNKRARIKPRLRGVLGGLPRESVWVDVPIDHTVNCYHPTCMRLSWVGALVHFAYFQACNGEICDAGNFTAPLDEWREESPLVAAALRGETLSPADALQVIGRAGEFLEILDAALEGCPHQAELLCDE
jgi:hypothetical protein